MSRKTAGPRRSAEERREEIIGIALRHFAVGGYRGTSTEAIAKDAGISQPYLFRLFRTKRELFIACCDRCHEIIQAAFRNAAAGVPKEDRFSAMGGAYVSLLEDRQMLLFQLQMYAACSDAAIRTAVRDGYRETVRLVARVSEESPEDVWGFFAHGMMLNTIVSLDLAEIADTDEWAAAWTRAGSSNPC